MSVANVLAQFASSGNETCFHGRHIDPQIYKDLNGSNWSLKDYEARGGYQALRKILGKDGGEGMTQDQVSEALHIGTEAVSRMERGITMPTVQRLAELAEVYGCGIDELLIASSTRTSDQAELISQVLYTLPEADRAMIVEVVQKIAARLKDRL